MKNRIATIILATLCACSVSAQEALWNRSDVQSPVINEDGSVTFNIVAPKAVRVEITGDFLPPTIIDTSRGKQEAPGSVQLEEKQFGLWTYTTSPLQPELYSYTVRIDGQPTLDAANIYVNRDVSTLSNIFIVSREANDRGSLYSVNEVKHGNVQKVWYYSPTLKMNRRMTVYTPAGYDKSKNFPVLYLLHGAGGDEDAWSTLGRAVQILDNLIALGKAKPMVVVMPNGNVDCQAAPGEWSKGMYTPNFQRSLSPVKPEATMDESFIDIMNHVESHFKVSRNRMHRAVCGLSMGGGHAFAIANQYPTRFAYIGLFSASIRIAGNYSTDSLYEKLLADTSMQQKIARVFASKPAVYWIGIGKTDFLYDVNADYRRFLDEKGYSYTYVETEGGHIWRNWRIYLTTFAQLLF